MSMTSILTNLFWAIFSAVCGVILAKILERWERKRRYIVYWVKVYEIPPQSGSEDSSARSEPKKRIRIIFHNLCETKLTEDDISQTNPITREIKGDRNDITGANEAPIRAENVAAIAFKFNTEMKSGEKNPNGFKLEPVDAGLRLDFQYWLKNEVVVFHVDRPATVKITGTLIEGAIISNKDLEAMYRRKYITLRNAISIITIILMMFIALMGQNMAQSGREMNVLISVIAATLPGIIVLGVWLNIYYKALIKFVK